MNLSAIQSGKTAAQRTAEDTAKRAVSHANSGLAFRNVSPTTQAAIVAKAQAAHAPVKPVAPEIQVKAPAAGSLDSLAPVLKAMTDGFANLAAAISAPVQKAAPPAPRPAAPVPASAPMNAADNTSLVSATKRARIAEITDQVQQAPQRAAQVRTISGNEPHFRFETAAQRRRSQQDAVAAQRSVENAAADRVLVSKGGAKVLALRALDATLSENALIALSHIIGKWQGADRRPVRVRASDVSDATGMSNANAQAALDELDAKKATITSINSVGTRLIQPGLGMVA